MKTADLISKTLEINAAKQVVWEVLTKPEYTTDWYKEFCGGTYSETDWQEGSKALFKDGKGNGIAGVISVVRPFDYLEILYKGIVKEGKEDYESDEALTV